MNELFDLSGKRFGSLTVIDCTNTINWETFWSCQCDCGKRKLIRSYRLRSGRVNSCGCTREAKNRFNKFEIIYDPSGAYVLVELTQGRWCKCDIDDWFGNLNNFKWYAKLDHDTDSFYVVTNLKIDVNGKKQINESMHRLILNVKSKSLLVDHVNHDPLDNRKYVKGIRNIRIVTHSQNSMNQKKRKDNTTGVTGISRHITKHGDKTTIYWNACVVSNKVPYRKIFPYTPEGFQSAKEWVRETKYLHHGEYAFNYPDHLKLTKFRLLDPPFNGMLDDAQQTEFLFDI